MDTTQTLQIQKTDPANLTPKGPEASYDPHTVAEGRVALQGAGVAAPADTIGDTRTTTGGEAEVWSMPAATAEPLAAETPPPPDVGMQ